MRAILRTSVAVAASLLLVFGVQSQAQTGGDSMGGQMGGQSGPARGADQGGRGGFGGAMGQPVQGTVTAATSSQITLKTDAGDSYEVTVTGTARITENRQAIQLTSIKIGDSVTAIGTVDATKKTVQAMMLAVIDAATVARAKENLGKTYITGKVTAIDADNLKLTIQRTDNVSQTIAVDEGTSFQRGTRSVSADVIAAGGLPIGMGGMGGGRGMGGNRQGGAQPAPPPTESITLADIKVGDNVMATGALKGGIFNVTGGLIGGVFTVLKMGVSDAAAAGMGGRRRTAEDQPGPPPPGSPPPSPPQQ